MRRFRTILLLLTTALALVAASPPAPLLHTTGKPTTVGQPSQQALDSNGTLYEWSLANGWQVIGVLGLPGGSAPSAGSNVPTSTVFNNYLTASPFPNVADPTDQAVIPFGFPTSGGPSLTNKLSLVFGTNNTTIANPCGTPCAVTSRAVMDSHLEHNQLSGTAGSNADGVVKDVNPAFIAAFRSYPAGDPHDTTVIDADALTFHAYCAAGSPLGSSCQGAGKSGAIVTGIVRPETAILPGDIVEACYKSASGTASWMTNWLFGGQYPAAGSNPNFYATGGFPYTTSIYFESDNPDGYAIADNSTPKYDLTYAYPAAGDDAKKRGAPNSSPTPYYLANSGKYSMQPQQPYLKTTDDRSTAMHCYQTYIKPPVYPDEATRIAGGVPTTRGQIVQYIDGVMVEASYDNWGAGNLVSWDNKVITGAIPTAGWMIGLQYGPTFLPGAVANMTPAGVAADTAKLYSMRVWHVTGGTMPAATLANALDASGNVVTANLIQHSNMTGATTGTPGSLPAGWSFDTGDVSKQVVAIGTDQATGYTYMDVRFYASATQGGYKNFTFGKPAITPNTPYTFAVSIQLVAGITPTFIGVAYNNDSNGNYTGQETGPGFTPTSTMQRYTWSYSDGSSSTATTSPGLYWGQGSGAVDFTLRFMAPQLETGNTAHPFVSTN